MVTQRGLGLRLRQFSYTCSGPVECCDTHAGLAWCSCCCCLTTRASWASPLPSPASCPSLQRGGIVTQHKTGKILEFKPLARWGLAAAASWGMQLGDAAGRCSWEMQHSSGEVLDASSRSRTPSGSSAGRPVGYSSAAAAGRAVCASGPATGTEALRPTQPQLRAHPACTWCSAALLAPTALLTPPSAPPTTHTPAGPWRSRGTSYSLISPRQDEPHLPRRCLSWPLSPRCLCCCRGGGQRSKDGRVAGWRGGNAGCPAHSSVPMIHDVGCCAGLMCRWSARRCCTWPSRRWMPSEPSTVREGGGRWGRSGLWRPPQTQLPGVGPWVPAQHSPRNKQGIHSLHASFSPRRYGFGISVLGLWGEGGGGPSLASPWGPFTLGNGGLT